MFLPLAQSGITFLVYVVLGLFWLVGNIAQQKKAKKRAEEMRRRREEREREEERTGKKPSKPHPLENDLETFLGRLSGEIFEDKEPETPPPLPPPKASPPPQRERPDSRPSLAEAQSMAKPDKIPKTDIGSITLTDSYDEIKDIEDALEIAYDEMESEVHKQTRETVHQVLVDLSPTMINFSRLPVQRLRSVDANTTPPNLKNKKAFKKAVLGGVILGPPLALQDPNTDER